MEFVTTAEYRPRGGGISHNRVNVTKGRTARVATLLFYPDVSLK